MNNEASFQRLAAVTSILAALLAFGSVGLQAVVLGVNTDPFSNLTHILEIGANGASLIRWGMILDMFGYYLLLAPLAVARLLALALLALLTLLTLLTLLAALPLLALAALLLAALALGFA